MPKIGLLPTVAMTSTGIMILLFVAGNDIGGGEIPMWTYSKCPPEDFLLQRTGIILQSLENFEVIKILNYIEEAVNVEKKYKAWRYIYC